MKEEISRLVLCESCGNDDIIWLMMELIPTLPIVNQLLASGEQSENV